MTHPSGIMPDVWGAGQLFAFSGIDGKTDWMEPFVLQTGAPLGSLIVRLPSEIRIELAGAPELRFSMVLGDVIAAESARGPFCCAFADHHTLIGELPEGAELVIGGQRVGLEAKSVGKGEKWELFAVRDERRWAVIVVFAVGAVEAANCVREALRTDLEDVIDRRAAFVRAFSVPAGLDEGRIKLLRKAISVMKVNVESPCGRIGRRWTTPDRWPHRNMWLWDSAFHGIGLAYVNPALGQDAVLAMLEQVHEDGRLAHMVTPTEDTEITQPPVLAWSAWTLLEKTDDRAWAKACVPYLFRYLEWIRTNRDKNGNGLAEWFIEGNALCRSGESGMDNSSRFDSAVLLDATDFSGFLCNDYRCLGKIAEMIGDAGLGKTCEAHANRIANAVNRLLWSPEHELYMDRTFDGAFIDVKASSGFVPLFAGIAERQQAEALRRHLTNPITFGTALPVPSLSVDSGTFCKDMWRGPTWMNYNYIIYRGLRRYGFEEDARRLKELTLGAVEKWYGREGCIFEYYDSLDVTSPRQLDRKQRLSRGVGIAPISDYHWTAAVTAAMILET